MHHLLTLALACALLGAALGSPNRAFGLDGHSSMRHLLQSGGGAGQNGTTGGQADAGDAAGGNPARAVVTTITLGDKSVKCDKWDAKSAQWVDGSGPEFTPKGSRTPGISTVQPYAKQICADTKAAGKALQQAVQGGGQLAEDWVYALFFTECSDSGETSALSATYQAAIDGVNSGDAAGLKAVQDWFNNFAKAADALGIPFCASVALVATADGSVVTESTHHSG